MWSRAVGGVFLCLIGLTWSLQGLDIAKGSDMSGHIIWTVLGIPLFVVGVVLLRAANALRTRA